MNANRTIFKAYATEAAAKNYLKRNLSHEPAAKVVEAGGTFYVIIEN